jgi:protein involved in polysaccharide export with SLBB domain
MTRLIQSLLLAVVLLAGGVLSAQTAPAAVQGLNPGDQVRIVVWRNPELSGDFTVAANGTLTHPLYREVQVTGIPISEVEDRLRTFLTRYTTNPQFVIQPLVKIIVSGEVRSPNLFAVPPETTVSQAIVLAGGPNAGAALDRVRLRREGQEIIVDMNRPDSQAATLQIRSGDQIQVPRAGNSFRDYIGPAASTVAALVSIASFVLRR